MLRIKTLLLTFAVIAVALLGSLSARQPEGKEPEGGLLIVVDANGKEHKLKTWKFVTGTANLSWLLAPKPAQEEVMLQKGGGKKQPPKVKEAPGPVALALTEGAGPPLKKGVMTYILLENIRQIDFDAKKEEVEVHVARSNKPAEDVVLKGVTGYVGINLITIEVREDLGELGQRVTEFKGGVKRDGLQSIRFPSPKPVAALDKTVKPYVVAGADKAKTSHPIFDVQALYRGSDGVLSAVPNLYFKETVKIDLGKVKTLARAPGGSLTYDVTLTDGRQVPALVLLERPPDSQGQLEGLVARVPAGWKVFPLPTVGELNAGAAKKNVKDI